MSFEWLKKYMPRGLYGRALLILLVPIIALQLVVSILFVQRHFEGVTRQMVDNVSLEISHIIELVESAPDINSAEASFSLIADPLNIGTNFTGPATFLVDDRVRLDLAGKTVVERIRASVSGVIAVDLATDQKLLQLIVSTRHGNLKFVLPRERVSASNPHQLLVFMIFTSVVMTLIAFMFLRNQLRPIRRLSRAAEAFGRGQSTFYKPSGAREVRSAGQAFLDMRARIERQIEQRTMMLSGVSHDLRTPITRLKLEVELLPQDNDSAAMLRDLSEMEHMLDEFLAFAKGDHAENAALSQSWHIASKCVEDAMRAQPQAEISLSPAQHPADWSDVLIKPMGFSRALGNLISNAVSFSSVVEVSVSQSTEDLTFRVEDNGPGIPPGQRETALKAFTRLDVARNQDRVGGVGLGLAIAADVARVHGGKLELTESSRFGGLCATITVPMRAANDTT
jgi:two-component system osmolarity sensor histidine kinase EnvZ